MSQNEQNNFNVLLSNVLSTSGIKYACGENGYSYVVYNDDGVLFTITYFKKGEYVFDPTRLLKKEYKNYGLPDNATPSPKMVFETVSFAYKIHNIAKKAHKNVSVIYNEILIDSDIVLQMRGNFETYMVMNSGVSGFAIGYDENTKKYGFKRYELVETFYKICEISQDKKPDYADLYKKTKEYYTAQAALENMQHLYDC